MPGRSLFLVEGKAKEIGNKKSANLNGTVHQSIQYQSACNQQFLRSGKLKCRRYLDVGNLSPTCSSMTSDDVIIEPHWGERCRIDVEVGDAL